MESNLQVQLLFQIRNSTVIIQVQIFLLDDKSLLKFQMGVKVCTTFLCNLIVYTINEEVDLIYKNDNKLKTYPNNCLALTPQL